MQGMKKVILLLLILSVLILSSQAVTAVGMVGNELNVKGIYEPGQTRTFSYSVGGMPPGGVDVLIEGDLADWLHPSAERIEADQESYAFTVDLVMTEDPLPPSGTIRGKVCIKESPPDTGQMVVALTKSCGLIQMLVLYDGQYPVVKLESDVSADFVNFTLNVRNDGKQGIQSVTADLNIFQLDGSFIEEVTLLPESYPLPSRESVFFSGVLDISTYIPGDYLVKTGVLTDGELSETEKTFTVGSEEVSLVEYTQSLSKGGIQKFEVRAKNEWAEDQDIAVKLKIESETLESTPRLVSAWMPADFDFFVDTSSLDLGDITATLVFTFGDGLISEEEIMISIVEGSGEVVEETEGSSGMSLWLITGIVVAVIIVLGGIIMFIRSRMEDEDEEDDF